VFYSTIISNLRRWTIELRKIVDTTTKFRIMPSMPRTTQKPALPGPQQAWLVGLSRGLEHALERFDGSKIGMRKAVLLARETARAAREAFEEEFLQGGQS
jgi:hypothetical protein